MPMTDQNAPVFHPLLPGEEELFAGACRIFEQSFPPEERDPVEQLAEQVARSSRPGQPGGDRQHFEVGLLEGQVWGAAIYGWGAATATGFLAYLATDPQRRNAGLGAAFYRHAVETLIKDGIAAGRPTLGMALEVERPEDAPTEAERELRTRRIGFYIRNGAFLLPGLDYWTPPLAPGLPALRYHVLYHPLAAPLPVARPELAVVVQTTLGFGYHLEAGDPYLDRALDNLPG
jgi:GNAT superfamily N-acetyltransferase